MCTAGAGAYAGCAYCCQQGEYCHALSKMVYLGHRSFLPTSDPLRLDVTNFPHKVVCDDDAPDLKTQKYVDDSNDEYAKKKTARARKEYAQSTGCTGQSALRSLPHHDRLLNTPVEPMHLVKCISEHVVKLVSGVEDSVKVRSEEKDRMRFPSTWSTQVQIGAIKKTVLPAAPFRLSKVEMKIANQRAMNIRTPHGTDWKPKVLFGDKVHLKRVQWKHVVASGILKYCIRGALGSFQHQTLFELCDVLSELVAEEVDMSHIDALEYRTHRVLALLERDFPVSLQVIVFHLLHHLPFFLKRFGPAYTFWMYPLERFNSWIARRVHNRRYPESTVIETYRLFEFTAFLSVANLLPGDSFADIDTVLDDDTTEDDLGDFVKTRLSGEKFESLKHFYRQSLTCSSDSSPNTSESSIQSDITPQRYIVKTDNHGRQVRYQPFSSSSKHSSCIVYMRIPETNEVLFGEVEALFKHKFNAQINSLACVRFFAEFEKDPSSKLIVVDTSKLSSHNSITSISTLSKPLIHVYDEEEESKLWILNAPLSM